MAGSRLTIAITGGLGDCLLATPFIRHFRRLDRYVRIDCACPVGAVQIFDQNPHLDRLIPCHGRDLFLWALPDEDSDVFCPYTAPICPEQIEVGMEIASVPLVLPNLVSEPLVRQVADVHGIDLEDDWLEIHTLPEDEEWAAERAEEWAGRRAILLNRESAGQQKNLGREAGQELVDRLGRELVVLEMPHLERPLTGTLVLQPLPAIRRSAALFRRLDCVLTVDSLAAHLASAVGTPAIVLFGPTNPASFGHSRNINLRQSDCPPCADDRRRLLCTHSRCMEEFRLDDVADAVRLTCADSATAPQQGASS